MAISTKDASVKIHKLHRDIVHALVVADQVWEEAGVKELVVTSARDGKHMKGSRHYTGQAVDLRTFTLKESERQDTCDRLAKLLGPKYDVVFEGDHCHVEIA